MLRLCYNISMDKLCRVCKVKPVEPWAGKYGIPKKSRATMCATCRREAMKRTRVEVNKYRRRDGYIHVRNEEGVFIAEHRLIMEKKIGRKLRRGETVHHIDGKRDNNAPENLELWYGYHVNGIRVEDLVCPHCGKKYIYPIHDNEERHIRRKKTKVRSPGQMVMKEVVATESHR